MRKIQIVRWCAAAGLCTSAVSLAQFVPLPPTQPQVHFWEPPKAEIPLRDQFGPVVRVLICNPDATAQQIVTGGVFPMDINLQGR